MLNPAKYDFTLSQGSTLRQAFVWKRTGVPVDLTGYTGRCHFRPTVDTTGAPSLDLTTENAGVVIEGVLGKVTIVANSIVTAGLLLKNYVYDVELSTPGGTDTFRLVKGTVTMEKAATK